MSWLSHIRETDGTILNMQVEPAQLKVNLGLQRNNVDRFKIVSNDELNGLTPLEFVRRNFYDAGSDSFVDIGEPPHDLCYREGSRWVVDTNALIQLIHNTRSQLLQQSDWTQLPNSPLSEDMKNAWAGYRQELRDITEVLEGIESLDDVPWPDAPA